MDAGAEKTQRGGGAGGREVYLTYMSWRQQEEVNGRGMSTGEGFFFFFSSDWGDVTLSVAGSSTLWREDP